MSSDTEKHVDAATAFERQRAAGNAAFDLERFIEASQAYSLALESWEQLPNKSTHDACVVRANRAAAWCKRKRWVEATEDCSWVIARPLEAGPRCVAKALFRRAFAHEGIGDAEAAEADLRAAAKIYPNDKLIANHLKNLKSVFHIAVVLDRASPEVLARQARYKRFHPETRRR